MKSEFVKHVPCPSCGSTNNAALYSSGWITCFTPGCGYRSNEEKSFIVEMTETLKDLPAGRPAYLPKRKLSAETAERWGYLSDGGGVEHAVYRDEAGKLVGVKTRYPDKTFSVKGNISDTLYGRHLCRSSGKRLVICEGEIDAMSYSQISHNGKAWYPVVSIPNGAASAVKAVKANLEWVESFEEVVLMFDMDEPGQEAAKAVAKLLKPGKAFIAKLPLKDVNECLVQGKASEVTDAFWGAVQYKPDGIVSGRDITELLRRGSHRKHSTAYPTPWPDLNSAMAGGLRKAELIVVGAGTGIGKSSLMKELVKSLSDQGLTVGFLSLEEDYVMTSTGLAALNLNVPYVDILTGSEEVTDEEVANAFIPYQDRVHLYDHWGSQAVDEILAKIRYMVQGLNCDFIVLDHLSILISGLALTDERKAIDKAMTSLRAMVHETGCGFVLVTHLSRPGQGEVPHEEGGRVRLTHLRGSHSIAQLADGALGLERDQQDPESSNYTTVRFVKPYRLNGFSGVAAKLEYIEDTGRLQQAKLNTSSKVLEGFSVVGETAPHK